MSTPKRECNHTRFNTKEEAMLFALNRDMVIVHCDRCHLWGLSYPSSQEFLNSAHDEYRRHLVGKKEGEELEPKEEDLPSSDLD
jgi:hypothetical protein